MFVINRSILNMQAGATLKLHASPSYFAKSSSFGLALQCCEHLSSSVNIALMLFATILITCASDKGLLVYMMLDGAYPHVDAFFTKRRFRMLAFFHINTIITSSNKTPQH